MRSLFVGFESTNQGNLIAHSKIHNVDRDYDLAIKRLHELGVMVNASFVFGMDNDGPDVFERTVEWSVERGIETATFHIMTPYPGTGLYARMQSEGRILHSDWDRYDTRNVVFKPKGMSADHLEQGYWSAYKQFYTWKNIWKGAQTKDTAIGSARHMAYSAGWKKFEPLWDMAIRLKRVTAMLPVLESVLTGFGSVTHRADKHALDDNGQAENHEASIHAPEMPPAPTAITMSSRRASAQEPGLLPAQSGSVA